MTLAGLHNWKRKHRTNEESVLRSYLLGDVDERLLDEVEIRLMCDKAYAERLSAAEDNLIDDYVFDRLSETERQKFQAQFLNNEERRNKILIAQAMEIYVGEKLPHEPKDYFTPSQLWHSSILFVQRHKVFVTCLVLAIALAAVLVSRLRLVAPNNAVTQVNVGREDLERRLDQLNRYDNNNLSAVEATLQSKRFREDSETQRVVVPANMGLRLKFQLPPGSRYREYGVSVQTVGGAELFKVNGLKTDASGAVLLKLIADAVPPGDYAIQLMGASEKTMSNVALYHLRVIHEPSR